MGNIGAIDNRMFDTVPRVAAVVLGGGSGTRLGLDPRQNKVYLELGGRSLLAWSIETLDAHPAIMAIVVAVRAGDEAAFDEVRRSLDVTTALHTIPGGPTRSASERAAFAVLRPAVEAGGIDLVVVHDGARPFLTSALLQRLIDAAAVHGSAIPGMALARPMVATEPDSTSARLVDAESLRRVQTPQVFAAGPLLAAYEAAAAVGFDGVDTAEVVARFSDLDAVVVPGDPDNLKVTTPNDLVTAEVIASRFSRAGR